MRYLLLVTGPAYGTQQASSALLFAKALIEACHTLDSVFFYREGVSNASQLITPATDEFDMVKAWQDLSLQHHINLNVCVSAALRRGVTGKHEAQQPGLPAANLAPGFQLSGLGALAESVLLCERVVQF